MLQVVIDQPRQRRPLPPVPLGLLFPGVNRRNRVTYCPRVRNSSSSNSSLSCSMQLRTLIRRSVMGHLLKTDRATIA